MCASVHFPEWCEWDALRYRCMMGIDRSVSPACLTKSVAFGLPFDSGPFTHVASFRGRTSKSAYAGRCYEMQQPPENGSNKRSVRVHYRGARAYSQLDEIRPIATNGLPLTHLQFASAQRPAVNLKHAQPASKIAPSGHSRIAREARQPYDCSTNILTRKREQGRVPCVKLKFRDRKVTAKRFDNHGVR